MSKGVVSYVLLNIHSPDIHGLDAGLRILVGIQSDAYTKYVALVDDTDRVLVQQDRFSIAGYQIDLRRPGSIVVEHRGNIIGRLEVFLFTRTRLSSLNLESAIEQLLGHLRIGNDDITASLIRAKAVLRRITCEVSLENEFCIVNDNKSRFVHGLQFSFNELFLASDK
jgi:hypothetical protein